jgi:aspartate carbamoyltransferase catalytic subunit
MRTTESESSSVLPKPTLWHRKDLLGIRELELGEVRMILDTAEAFKTVGSRDIKKVPALRGKTLVNFFVEPSTRTRISFELAAVRLSADVVNIAPSTSSLQKGETLKDTALNLQALHADIIVLRHSSAGAPKFLADRLSASIINAGDGAHEHPTRPSRRFEGCNRRRHIFQQSRAIKHLGAQKTWCRNHARRSEYTGSAHI